MNFTKMQGAGNDFIFIDSNEPNRIWRPLAAAMCDRHFGIGGDGLIVILPSDSANLRMRIFNADGSEAEACGNGLRCVVRYAVEKKRIRDNADKITIETKAGIREANIQRRGGSVSRIQVELGKPMFLAGDIPVNIKDSPAASDGPVLLQTTLLVRDMNMLLHFVSMGNPHAVFFTDKPVSEFPLKDLGPLVENHPLFPRRINFEVARVLEPGQIEARVWERGCGETLACGTGACAIAVSSRLLGYSSARTDVRLPGGTLNVEWDGSGEVLLAGPTEVVFTGIWPD